MKNHPRGKGSRSCSDSTGPGAASLSEGYTEAEVALGQQIRDAYVRERSAYESARAGVPVQWQVPARWDGKPMQVLDTGEPAEGGKAIGPTWPKIARCLLTHRIAAVHYVRWAFMSRLLSAAPEPNHLHSDKFVNTYVATRNPAQERAQHEVLFQSQRTRAATDIGYRVSMGYSERDAYLMAATDVANELTPLFRYCLAAICKHEGLMADYFPDAAIQFCRAQSDYLAVWGRYLPAGFGESAARFYREKVLGEVPEDAECRPE